MTNIISSGIFVVPLLAGVAVHLALRPIEIDSYALRLIIIYPLIWAAVFFELHLNRGLDIADSFTKTLVIAGSFNTGLFGSILIYRGRFHRLHRFPGPFLAKLSRLYALRDAALTNKSHIALKRLHEKYGDFVRVGPREIAIFRRSAVTAIYGPNSKCYRSAQYDNPSPDAAESSIVGTRDPVAHRRRKRAWDRGLGFRALGVYEPRVKSKVDLMLSRLALHEGFPVNMTDLCRFLGFDVMGDIGYSKDFGMLESGQDHPAIKGIREQTTYIGVLGTVPWFFISLVTIMNFLGKLGLKSSFQSFLDWCSREMEAKRAAVRFEKESASTNDPQDVMSWLIKAEDEGDGSAPPGEGAFQEDSRVLIVAGSDTTSVAITNAFYYLAKYPAVYHKLQDMLDAEFPGGEADYTYARLKNIPYLDAIIHETLRLKPSVPSGLPRLTPPGGLQVDEVFIPGEIVVSVPAYTIQRDPRYWDKPLEFVPERWDADKGLTPEKAPFIPFTRGQYACPGRHLAMMEMRMVLSRAVLRYQRMEFADPGDVERFDEGALIRIRSYPINIYRREKTQCWQAHVAAGEAESAEDGKVQTKNWLLRHVSQSARQKVDRRLRD